MNIVQIHERTRFWLDRVATARFDSFDIDNALNIALNDLVDAKYNGSKLNPGDSFQKTQKIRDDLSSIVKIGESGSTITISNSTGSTLITKAGLPADFRYLLCIAFYETATIKHNCWPLSYDRENVVEPNPYRRVRTGPFPKLYYNESNLGIKITHPFSGNPNKVVIYYLANPVQYSYGIERLPAFTFTVNPTSVIVTSETVVYNAVTYLLGTKFNITSPASFTSGTVISDFTESDINVNLHEQIARRAAINALITIGEREKSLDLIKIFD